MQIDRESKVYLRGKVRSPIVLDAQLVEMALVKEGVAPVWVTAEWVGAAGLVRECRFLYLGTTGKGVYLLKGRVTAPPELPVFRFGLVELL